MEFTIERRFNAPRHAVYGAFTDLERLPERLDAIDTIEPAPGHDDLTFADGLAFRETRTIMGKRATETMVVRDVVPDERFTLTSESHGCAYRFDHAFTDEGDATLLTMHGVCRATSLLSRVMMVVFFPMRGMMPKLINKDLDAMEAWLAGHTAP
ncbi:MAG: SRPBCC family protein [Planctomycetota bacterium]